MTSSASAEVPPFSEEVKLASALTLPIQKAKWGHQEAVLAEKVFASAGRDVVVNVQMKVWVWSPQPPLTAGRVEFGSVSPHGFFSTRSRILGKLKKPTQGKRENFPS